MDKLINRINEELNCNLDFKNLKESIIDLKKDFTIFKVKTLTNVFFPQFSSIVNEKENSSDFSELNNLFLESSSLYNDWLEAKVNFEDKTMRVLEDKNKSGINLLTKDEIENICEVFLDENQNIYESTEFLKKDSLIDKLCRKFNKTILKENINLLFAQ